jgi:ribosome biogenesis protein SSF1/2
VARGGVSTEPLGIRMSCADNNRDAPRAGPPFRRRKEPPPTHCAQQLASHRVRVDAADGGAPSHSPRFAKRDPTHTPPLAMAKTRRTKHRTHVEATAKPGETKNDVPKSFVMKRGKLCDLVSDLTEDVRKVMEPHTAVNLKESKTNKLKDFVQVAGPLGISHFLILSATDRSKYVKICRAPRGPTLSFRVHKYTLAREVQSSQKNPRSPPSAFRSPPLVVLNNFGDAPHQKLATITFQNLFPPINVKKVKLSTCQRAVLIDYDKTTNRFQFRHYSISAAPTGANRSLRKLLTTRQAPDLGALTDVSEFFERAGDASDASDSEGEDAVAARVDLTQDYNRVAKAESRSRVILQEIGPRMELELTKVEEGMCEGRVLYHAYVQKTEDEVVALEQKKVDSDALRKSRKEEQEQNVRRKEKEKTEKLALAEELAGRKKRKRDKSKADETKSTFDKHFDKKYNVGGINDIAKEKRDKRRKAEQKEKREGGGDETGGGHSVGRASAGKSAGGKDGKGKPKGGKPAGKDGKGKGKAPIPKSNARPGKSVRAKKR